MAVDVVCLWPLAAELGEGPIWAAGESALYFVDIKQRRVHRWRDRERRSWDAPSEIGFVAPCSNGDLVAGLEDGLWRFQPSAERWERLLEVEPDRPGNRINDGFVDPSGALWFGTMDNAETAPTGRLYLWRSGRPPQVRDDGYVITNGPAMSPDGRTLYHTDTMARRTYAFDVDDAGALSGKRRFVDTPTGYPDGMAVDAEGYVWIAVWDGWRIDRYDPAGRLERSIAFPCANVTKLAFGRDDLRTVYVTTARKGLTPEALAAQPLAGGLFTFKSPVPGLPATRFSL